MALEWNARTQPLYTAYPKKYAHGFVVLCFVVVMQSFIMNSHEVFIHIHQGCFAGTGAIVRLPQCQWSKPDGYGKISQCITTAKQKPCAYFLGYTVYTSIHITSILHKMEIYTKYYHNAKYLPLMTHGPTIYSKIKRSIRNSRECLPFAFLHRTETNRDNDYSVCSKNYSAYPLDLNGYF